MRIPTVVKCTTTTTGSPTVTTSGIYTIITFTTNQKLYRMVVAELEDGIVQRVSIGDNPDTLSASFTWVETFLDGGSRRNMDGGNYNSENDIFYAEQPSAKYIDSWMKKHIHMGGSEIQQNQKVIMIWNETDGACRIIRQVADYY